MQAIRNHQFRRSLCLFLLLVFFGNQAFGCVTVNKKMVHFISQKLFSKSSNNFSENHSCCAKQSSSIPSAMGKGCCVQDANIRLPQIVSEQITLPDMPLMVIATLPLPVTDKFTFQPEFRKLISANPPLYLTSLQLLI